MPKGNGSMLTRPMDGKRYVLASGSPRRRELLAMLNVNFRVDTSRPVDEVVPPTLPAAEVPAYLSRLKAQPYLADLQPDEILITADTVVILDRSEEYNINTYHYNFISINNIKKN